MKLRKLYLMRGLKNIILRYEKLKFFVIKSNRIHVKFNIICSILHFERIDIKIVMRC